MLQYLKNMNQLLISTNTKQYYKTKMMNGSNESLQL